jgi:indolepyruvate ferredoxin oxidoreductase beta subunit
VLDFSAPEWHAAIDASVPPRTREVNRAAFERGRESARSSEAGDGVRPASRQGEAEWIPEAVEIPALGSSARIEIDAAWCKGCDICVKLCPERCLALDERQVALLTDPWACTGCRICEWLCPDFAIRVRTGVASAEEGS